MTAERDPETVAAALANLDPVDVARMADRAYWGDDDPRGIADLAMVHHQWPDLYGGWTDTEYRHAYTVNAKRAETMHRTFGRIDAYNRRHEARNGPPVDAAASILRLAAALGAATFLLDAPDRDTDTTYKATNYRQTDASGAADYMRRAIRDYRASLPTPTPSAD